LNYTRLVYIVHFQPAFDWKTRSILNLSSESLNIPSLSASQIRYIYTL